MKKRTVKFASFFGLVEISGQRTGTVGKGYIPHGS